MKRLLIIIPILALLLLVMGCGGIEGITNRRAADIIDGYTGNFTVKVGGTVGLDFMGEYEAWFFHYDPDTGGIVYTKDSYNVEGQVPQEYTFEAASTAVIFQKRTDDWWTTLEVEVWRDGVLLARRETTDPWGVVWAIAGG
jgi:hypothetical protein